MFVTIIPSDDLRSPTRWRRRAKIKPSATIIHVHRRAAFPSVASIERAPDEARIARSKCLRRLLGHSLVDRVCGARSSMNPCIRILIETRIRPHLSNCRSSRRSSASFQAPPSGRYTRLLARESSESRSPDPFMFPKTRAPGRTRLETRRQTALLACDAGSSGTSRH